MQTYCTKSTVLYDRAKRIAQGLPNVDCAQQGWSALLRYGYTPLLATTQRTSCDPWPTAKPHNTTTFVLFPWAGTQTLTDSHQAFFKPQYPPKYRNRLTRPDPDFKEWLSIIAKTIDLDGPMLLTHDRAITYMAFKLCVFSSKHSVSEIWARTER